MQIIQKMVYINAPISKVWKSLTHIPHIQEWLYEEPIEIQTTWKVGDPIITRGDLHGLPFINSGTILAFQTNLKLSYTFLSSISNLPALDENHCILEFNLIREHHGTKLELTIVNFPDDVIFKHLNLYWGATLELIKQQTESRCS